MTLLDERTPEQREQRKAIGRRRRAWIAPAAVVVFGMIVGSILWAGAGEEPTPGPEETTQVTQGSQRETLERLVNLGYIPKQALEPSREEKREQILKDLVNRGLIPREALSDAP